MVITKTLTLNTKGFTDVIDITGDCRKVVSGAKCKNGVLTICNPGSTGAVTTIEYEPNLVKDLKEALEKIAPVGKTYHHEKTWHDDNGSGHIRSTLMGPSLTVPFTNGELTLGTWQQIIFCDFDTSPRRRNLILQVMGE